MSEQPTATPSLDPAAAAAYIADIVASLATMARRHRFDALGYLLEMARLEAEALSSPRHRRHPD